MAKAIGDFSRGDHQPANPKKTSLAGFRNFRVRCPLFGAFRDSS
jgi:hypothetical protein